MDPLENIKINDIELKDIDARMPCFGFISKTIEKLVFHPAYVDFKFTDGTYGVISISKSCDSEEEHQKLLKMYSTGEISLTGGIIPSIS